MAIIGTPRVKCPGRPSGPFPDKGVHLVHPGGDGSDGRGERSNLEVSCVSSALGEKRGRRFLLKSHIFHGI